MKTVLKRRWFQAAKVMTKCHDCVMWGSSKLFAECFEQRRQLLQMRNSRTEPRRRSCTVQHTTVTCRLTLKKVTERLDSTAFNQCC
jgi:hypothetical protein